MFAFNPSMIHSTFPKTYHCYFWITFLLSSKPVSPTAFCVSSLRSSVKSESCSVLSESLRLHGILSPWNSPGQNTGVGSLSCLQGIFPTKGSNPDLPHFLGILYHLSHMGIPRILEWVAYPTSPGDLSDPGIEPGSPVLQANSLPYEVSGKPQKSHRFFLKLHKPQNELFPLRTCWALDSSSPHSSQPSSSHQEPGNTAMIPHAPLLESSLLIPLYRAGSYLS